MATSYSAEKKNNLELYLNDVYDKECVFQIEKEEVEFIQTGIETLVQDLVDTILADHESVHKPMSDHLDESLSLMEEIHGKSTDEVYFSKQSDCSLQRYVAGNKCQRNTVKIIKVGSFYDGTKNGFPDEFDFIVPLLDVRTSLTIPYRDFIDFEKTIGKHIKPIHHTSLSEKYEVRRELKFGKYIERHGPAIKLQFIYSNGFGEQRHIHVDLVPAFRIIDSNTLQWFVEYVRYVEPKTFHEEILAAGSSLSVRGTLAFTEIEQNFMKNILSKKHVKVYRILKYLLNGHGEGEKFEEQFRHDPYYTSYRIKILLIYHHDACTNTNTDDLGPCVLHVLKEMSKYESTEKFPAFSRRKPRDDLFKLLPYLKSTIKTLQLMQTSEKSKCYSYDTDKIKSVTGQYLDSLLHE